MTDPIITNNDLGSVILEGGYMTDDVATFTGAATYVEGLIMARDSVTLKLIAYVKGGTTNGNGVAVTALTEPITAAGAGDETMRMMNNGALRRERLVILADGDASNIDAVETEQLRGFGLVVKSSLELGELDNQ